MPFEHDTRSAVNRNSVPRAEPPSRSDRNTAAATGQPVKNSMVFIGVGDYAHDEARHPNKIAPEGVDVAFEGVGGRMLQTVLEHLKEDGRLLQVGYISEYPHNPARGEESAANEADREDAVDGAKVHLALEEQQRGEGKAEEQRAGKVVVVHEPPCSALEEILHEHQGLRAVLRHGVGEHRLAVAPAQSHM